MSSGKKKAKASLRVDDDLTEKEKALNLREEEIVAQEDVLGRKLKEVEDEAALLAEDRTLLVNERKSFEEMANEQESPTAKVVFANLKAGTLREQCEKVLEDCGMILGHSGFDDRLGGDSTAPIDIAYSKIESAIASLTCARDKSQ